MKKIILDTDLGGDCDDVGALAVALNLVKSGEADLLAVTYCIGSPWGSDFIRHMLDTRGFSQIPLGVLHDTDFMNGPDYEKSSRPYCEAFRVPHTEHEDAVRLLRRTLAENGDRRDITLIAIGPLRNIANLLASGPDDISPRSGSELVAANVCLFSTMLGNFAKPGAVEWNVLMDIPSAAAVVDSMPAPILFCPFEIGSHILTGANNEARPDDHHIRFSYHAYARGKSFLRQSWDPITVYATVRDDTPLYRRRETHAHITPKGCCQEDGDRGMFVLEQAAADDAVTAAIDALMI